MIYRQALLELLMVVGDEEKAMFTGTRLNAAFLKASEALSKTGFRPVGYIHHDGSYLRVALSPNVKLSAPSCLIYVLDESAPK